MEHDRERRVRTGRTGRGNSPSLWLLIPYSTSALKYAQEQHLPAPNCLMKSRKLMHLISTAVQNRDWLKFTGRIRPSLLPRRSTSSWDSAPWCCFPVFQGSGKCPRQTGRALVMKHFGGDGLKGSWIGEQLTETQFPFCFSKHERPLPARSPDRIPQHSLHRSLFSATSVPTPPWQTSPLSWWGILPK